MFNFKNIFRNDNVTDIIQSIKDKGPVDMNYADPVKVPGTTEVKHALFTVGINEDGMTQLTVGYPSSIVLTLNDASVVYLIKQLAVNIDQDYFVNVKRKDNE